VVGIVPRHLSWLLKDHLSVGVLCLSVVGDKISLLELGAEGLALVIKTLHAIGEHRSRDLLRLGRGRRCGVSKKRTGNQCRRCSEGGKSERKRASIHC